MKKLLMTPDEYYNRRTIIDEIEEKRGWRLGCLTVFVIIFTLMVYLILKK